MWCGSEVCEDRSPSGTVEARVFWHGVQKPAGSVFFARGHLTTIEAATDDSSNLVARYSYEPFGKHVKTAGSGTSTYRFTGHRYHEFSGIVLTLRRGYDPALGRWLSEDPSGVEESLNL